MQRRHFLHSAAVLSAGAGLSPIVMARDNTETTSSKLVPLHRSFSLTDRTVRIHCDAVTQPVRLVMMADTHLGLQDAREEPFQQYSGRMAKAYVKTTNPITRQPTTPQESFIEGLNAARKARADLVTLVGDLFSFPSEANVDWALQELQKVALPYLYVTGNHDWHYEGMEGSSEELRDTWIQKRLAPFFQGADPLITSRDIKGVRIVMVDDSTYQILPAQLATFRKLIDEGLPTVVFLHIPLYVPGRHLGFGCGHPSWGAKADKGYTIERRPPWRESGHTQTTLDFHREIFAAPNVLGIFAGHTHQPPMDVVGSIPQIVTDDNASGGRLEIEILPMG